MNNKGSNAAVDVDADANANANGSDCGSVNAFKVNQAARSWAWLEEGSRGEGEKGETGKAWPGARVKANKTRIALFPSSLYNIYFYLWNHVGRKIRVEFVLYPAAIAIVRKGLTMFVQLYVYRISFLKYDKRWRGPLSSYHKNIKESILLFFNIG